MRQTTTKEGESRLREFAPTCWIRSISHSSDKIWQSSSNGYEPEGREAVIDHLNELVEMLKKHLPFRPMKEIKVERYGLASEDA
jgi:hypothetical protein